MPSRYLYIKNGDAVAQLQRIAKVWPAAIHHGPDAFLNDFLLANRGAEILLMARARRNARIRFETFTARVFAESTGAAGRGPANLRMLVSLLTTTLRSRPERILCGTTGSPLWGCFLLSKLLSIPLVHSRHNRISHPRDRWPLRPARQMDAFILRRVDAVVCHGPYLRDELLSIGVGREKVFEFDVGFTDFPPAEGPGLHVPSPVEEPPVILYMGRIERNKGVFDLLQACTTCGLGEGRVRLVYAGQGRHLDQLREAVRSRGLEDRVSLLGHVPHEELIPLITRSLAVATPTHDDFPEGRCMAAMEALVAGTPVIAPDFGPFRYLIKQGENGVLFSPNSVAALAEALTALTEDRPLRERLRKGARRSGDALRTPAQSFAPAVESAFRAADNDRSTRKERRVGASGRSERWLGRAERVAKRIGTAADDTRRALSWHLGGGRRFFANHSAEIGRAHKWCFIVGCNNSGTSLLQHVLEQGEGITSFPQEGQRYTRSLKRAEKRGHERVWSEYLHEVRMTEASDTGPLPRLLHDWCRELPPPIGETIVEKTTANVVRTRWLQKVFERSYFIGVVRNGYAVSEGIRRKGGKSVVRGARHWNLVNRIMLRDAAALEHFLLVRYEQLVADPLGIVQQIRAFLGLPAIDSLNGVDGIADHNAASIARLSEQEIADIRAEAAEMLDYLGYALPSIDGSDAPAPEPSKDEAARGQSLRHV